MIHEKHCVTNKNCYSIILCSPERHGSISTVCEHSDDAHAAGQYDAGPDSLQRPEEDEQVERGRKTAGKRGDEEDGHAALKHHFLVEHITKLATHRQETAEKERHDAKASVRYSLR